ncbi:RHS repeat-associated core domain-containing protein [Phocaeicola sp. HCN-6420]|uniref:RHS repeat-associated core domain-containing protein n=1 Tax=Phocaeicola sp. HCN-6420 TaxID=3134673 RepID=UPI00404079E9
MKTAEYGEGERLAVNPNRFNEEVTAYDKTENILGIRRMGQTGAQEYGLVDNLVLTYSGNQLTKVTDNAASSAYNNGFEFKDGADRETEYIYDENGNLTQDLNRNIEDIQYNFLNLPQRIEFEDGSTTEYLYDAEGRKLRTVHRADGKTTTTDYAGNLIYENGKPARLLTGYGYVSLPDGMYHYYLKDYQGNNRVVADRNGKVEEVNHYYPFGGMFANNGNVQPYKYNGKELDTRKGLNWYDYGVRHYDPAVGRFITSDPLSEKDYFTSSYVYCGSNPINRIDKDGRIWETVWDAASLSLGINSFWKNISEGSYGAATIDGAGVVIDAIAAAVPFIPGGAGAVINSVRATDKISDVAKSTNRAGKAIEKSNNNIKIDIAPENKIDRSLLNPPSKPGLAPTFKSDGTPVEIHHINQNPKGPFKEMSKQEHRGKGNYKKNHSNHNKESQIDRSEFNRAKKEYWKNEYEQK